MFRTIIRLLIIGPLAVIIIAFAVANRHWVSISFDPLGGADPGLSFSAPLFLLILISVMIGIVLGGAATWVRQGRQRKAARANSREAARWRSEAKEAMARAKQAEQRQPALAGPPGTASGGA